jgi:two-component system C4-dicarboxylate transport response regulator DctD
MVIDDEPFIAEETAVGLQLNGYSTLTAGSASEALVLLDAHPEIGVIISDIRMPGLDGVLLVKRALIGRNDENALGIILMTGHAVNAPPEGVSACIAKPFAMQLLVDVIASTMAEVMTKRGFRS